MRTLPVTLVVPTLNGGRRFVQQLECLARSEPAPARVVVIDSGSDDGTDRAAERAGCEVVRIDRATFDHGATRQAGAERATTPFVAFLTQDAVPAQGWLEPLVDALADPGVAGASSRILPYPDSSPCAARTVTSARSARPDAFVARFAAGEFSRMPPERRRAAYVYDDVASCARTSLLREHPLPRTMMGEDVIWAEAMLERGLGIAYASASIVHHAHEYGLRSAFRRYRDDAAFVRRRYGLAVRPSLVSVARGLGFEWREDLRFMRASRAEGKLRSMARSFVWRLGQVSGQWWGTVRGGSP